MEKFNLACDLLPPVIHLSEIFRRWQRNIYLLLSAILLLMFTSMPASAAVEGILTKDSDGSYHQYSYKELLGSYAASLMGKPDGLFEDFANKEPVALFDSGNGYIDYAYILDQYAKTLVEGKKFIISEIIERKDAHKAETPAMVSLVTFEYGQLVRLEKSLIGQDASEAAPAAPATKTPIIEKAKVSLSKAQAWAESKNAHQRFIDIAPLYWEYGKMTGIRPEVLYAQAAYESGYGHFNGLVPPEFNNWTGIKVGGSNGDQPEDHQQFDTPEEGVRAHFNHISAYLGLDPVGEPHDRYYSVKSISWAGTVEYVEELSGKWAQSPTYHETIVRMIGEMK